VTARYDDYDITPAGRAVSEFVTENLSNWYVRLNRKRYWGGGMDEDKLSAYQTLYTCLETVALLASPIIPFYTDRIFTDLNSVRGRFSEGSVHLAPFPSYDEKLIDKDLEERMEIAQKMSSMILALRRKVNIRVRQPLAKIMVPVTDAGFREKFEAVRPLVLAEVNVKDVEYVDDTSGILVRRIKPNFKLLGPSATGCRLTICNHTRHQHRHGPGRRAACSRPDVTHRRHRVRCHLSRISEPLRLERSTVNGLCHR